MSARRAGFLGDSRGLSVTAILLAMIVAAALFVVSYQGLAHAAEAIGLHRAPWIVPIAIDGGILVAGLLAAVRRGQKRRATLELTILWAATFASSGANVIAHVERGDGILAVVVAASAPIFFLAVTESIIRTVIQDEVVARKPRRVQKPATAVESAAASAPPRPVEQTAPRKARAVASIVPAVDVAAMSESDLLERARALAPDPASRQRGTEESIVFRSVALALIDRHGWTPTTLAAEVGDADRNRIERVTRTLRQKLQQAA